MKTKRFKTTGPAAEAYIKLQDEIDEKKESSKDIEEKEEPSITKGEGRLLVKISFSNKNIRYDNILLMPLVLRNFWSK